MKKFNNFFPHNNYDEVLKKVKQHRKIMKRIRKKTSEN